MFNKKYLFVIAFLFTLNQAYGVEGGYFDTQNGSEYLGFANMNKEFQITSLMNSAIANDSKATKIFIASGADVNATNIGKVSALHLAARNYAYDSAQVLIENGANVNAKDLEGWTPLMRANLNGDEKIIQLLLDNGASIWVQNVYGDSALVHAAMSDCYECGKLLLENSTAPKTFIREQVSKALNITKKRYNEPFIELLTGYISGGENLVLSSNIKSAVPDNTAGDISSKENITRIIYKFLGKTINASELDEINKNFKLNQKDISQNMLKANNHSKTVEDKKMIKSFSFSGKKDNSSVLENDLKKNEEVVEHTKKIEYPEDSEKKFTFKEGEKPMIQNNIVEDKSSENSDISSNQTNLESKSFKLNSVKKIDTQKIETNDITIKDSEKKFTFKEGQKPAVQNNVVENSGIKNQSLSDSQQTNLENKSFKLNGVKNEDIQKTEQNNIVVEDTTDSKNYKLNSVNQNNVPISDEEEFEKVYSLQSDKNTLN